MSERRPTTGTVIVEATMYAVVTQVYRSKPPRSAMMRGMAVLTTVWSRAAKNKPVMAHAMMITIWRRGKPCRSCFSDHSRFLVEQNCRLTLNHRGISQSFAPMPESKGRTMVSKTIHIRGMTCAACVSHVTEAISSVPGVANPLKFHWRPIRQTLSSRHRLLKRSECTDTEILGAISAAVDEAGYGIAIPR